MNLEELALQILMACQPRIAGELEVRTYHDRYAIAHKRKTQDAEEVAAIVRQNPGREAVTCILHHKHLRPEVEEALKRSGLPHQLLQWTPTTPPE
jgi:hypothetical protein